MWLGLNVGMADEWLRACGVASACEAKSSVLQEQTPKHVISSCAHKHTQASPLLALSIAFSL